MFLLYQIANVFQFSCLVFYNLCIGEKACIEIHLKLLMKIVLPFSVDEAADTFHENDTKRFSRESEGSF